ncbi:MAG: pitrilysin family protein [candidate division KSB1 bacterium]|nr:pitrilysin family protein [candidate division KSB1 bacterium]
MAETQLFETPTKRTVLDNGIRVVTERVPYVRSVAAGVWVQSGSSNETEETNGIAHFLEHMLFKGTRTRSAMDLANSLESLGGHLNGSTGREVSMYSAYILNEHVDTALEVLADLTQNPRFKASDIDVEKQVVLSELMRSLEDPEELAFDYFYQYVYHNHPLGYLILGTPDNIRSFQQQDLTNFHSLHYSPNRMVVAAAGNIEHDTIVKHVERLFRTDPRVEPGKTGPIQAPVDQKIINMKNLQQAHILLGYQTFGLADERRYALALLDVMLGSGMSSRLFQNIREAYGFTYNVFSFLDLMRDTGVFGAYAASEPDKVDRTVGLLQREIDRIKKGDIGQKELDKVKSQVRGSLVLSFESTGRRMKKIGESEIYQRPHQTIQQVLDRVKKVKIEDMVNAANHVFQDQNKCLTVLTPE